MTRAHFDVGAFATAVAQHFGVVASQDAEIDAERRRAALRRFIGKTGLSIGAFATKAQVTPSLLYNFLSVKEKRSRSLSQQTYEKLAKAHKTTIAELSGEAEDVLRAQLLAGFDQLSDAGKLQAVDILNALVESSKKRKAS